MQKHSVITQGAGFIESVHCYIKTITSFCNKIFLTPKKNMCWQLLSNDIFNVYSLT